MKGLAQNRPSVVAPPCRTKRTASGGVSSWNNFAQVLSDLPVVSTRAVFAEKVFFQQVLRHAWQFGVHLQGQNRHARGQFQPAAL